MVVNLGVQYLRDLQFWFVVDHDRRWRRLDQGWCLERLAPTWRRRIPGVQHEDCPEVEG